MLIYSSEKNKENGIKCGKKNSVFKFSAKNNQNKYDFMAFFSRPKPGILYGRMNTYLSYTKNYLQFLFCLSLIFNLS